jgi:hypothetical protein
MERSCETCSYALALRLHSDRLHKPLLSAAVSRRYQVEQGTQRAFYLLFGFSFPSPLNDTTGFFRVLLFEGSFLYSQAPR